MQPRGRATNRCDYCARLFAVETSEMLLLDALEDAPTLYAVLTARELLERSDCRDHLQHLRRSLRKRWPAIRWAVLVEFQRRGALHLNLLIKGVPVDQAAELHERICASWCTRVDAEPIGQWVGRVNDGAGLVRYISLHFLKPDQAPPHGWRGHRFSATRDYFAGCTAAVARQRAREALRLKRELWKLEQAGVESAGAREELAHAALRRAAGTRWVLTNAHGARLSADRVGGELVERLRELEAGSQPAQRQSDRARQSERAAAEGQERDEERASPTPADPRPRSRPRSSVAPGAPRREVQSNPGAALRSAVWAD